jgi:CheY-like chemotaxis protein
VSIQPQKNIADNAASSPNTRLRLLIVDDNPANQAVVQMLLAQDGHKVDVAWNGQEALEQLSGTRYDAVLLDCQMPILDGYETARRIRSGKLRGIDPAQCIIAVTAYAMNGDRRRCLEAGMNDYVAKPLRLVDLHEAFSRCGLRAPGSEAARLRSSGPPPPLDSAALEFLRKLPGRRGPSLLPELAETIGAELPKKLAALEQLAQMRDSASLVVTAHTLAGSCASIGAQPMRDAALALERAASEHAWPLMPVRLAALNDAWRQVRRELRLLDLIRP